MHACTINEAAERRASPLHRHPPHVLCEENVSINKFQLLPRTHETERDGGTNRVSECVAMEMEMDRLGFYSVYLEILPISAYTQKR